MPEQNDSGTERNDEQVSPPAYRTDTPVTPPPPVPSTTSNGVAAIDAAGPEAEPAADPAADPAAIIGADIAADLATDLATAVADDTSVLIVDDNVRNLMALEATLQELNVRIDRATSGEDALRRLLEREYAVILLDVQMPGIDGFETATIIRERQRSQHTPIIFLTAYDTNHQQAFTGYSVGAVDYISKPYDPDILKAKVTTFVELYRKREEVRRQSALLAEINRKLEERNGKIESLNRQISTMNQELEQRVHRRTVELEKINAKLTEEIGERERVEAEVRLLNSDLERRVQERTSDLEAFSYSLSHDLRAPLRSIDGFSKVLEEGLGDKLDEEEGKYLQRIRASCGRMHALIDDMLMLARATHGDMQLREIDVTRLATEIADELRLIYPDHNVAFTAQPDIRVTADNGLMRIALFNLLDNAWKFTLRAKRPTVSITLADDEAGSILIRDNGSGFNADGAAKLFKPFQRFHSAQEFSGTGIGLAIVHRIVTRHGGEISVASAEGKGTTITLSL